MRCQHCERENPPEARFCMHCGGSLRVQCPQCGAILPPAADAQFCISCGADLGATPTPPARHAPGIASHEDDERRRVTVLFADLAGFTALCERLDPEDVRELQDAYFSAMTQAIETYGGTVEKYVGDAVLAVFGVPRAHEEDPERAVRAALAMQQAMATVNDQFASVAPASALSLRIGVHTGLVVSRVDRQGGFAVSGDTVNLASRLQGAAEPGTVLISAETTKLVGHAIDCEPLQPIAVKGKVEAVPVFRAIMAKAAGPKLRGLAGLASPLVGRQAETRAVQEALERLRAGVGGIVTIVGEAGIGKSRLVAEARRSADQPVSQSPRRGLESALNDAISQSRKLAIPQWIEGRCLSYGGSIAYLLWLDLLHSILGRTLDDAPDAVREVLREWVERLCPTCVDDVYPYLGQLMTLPMPFEVSAMIAELDGEELKRRTFQAVSKMIESAAERQPLVLVCDDLHWSDASSLELLEHVLKLTDRTGLLVFCVFRPDTGPGSWRLRETIARDYRHRHTDLWLQPLTAGDSEALVTNLLHSNPSPGLELPSTRAPAAISPKLLYRILSQAEGNPFYVEEVLRTLIDDGLLVQDDAGAWIATREVAEIELPATLQGVLMARIDRLEDDTRRILQLAAVIGRIFLYRVLVEIATEQQALDQRLLTLQRQELIRERARIPELEYIFKHELTREAAYIGILKKQRRQFHRQVAEALERLYPGRIDELVGLLAYHWEHADDPDKAVEYLRRAGDQARLAYAQEEALGYYQRALAILEQSGNHAGMALVMMDVGLTHHNAFDSERARQAYDEAFALWRRRQAPALARAPHALRLGTSWGLRNVDPATRWNVGDGFWQDLLLAGLIHVGSRGEVVPELAARWDILDEGRIYVFKLDEQAHWTDGAAVTAHDFEFAWKRLLDRRRLYSGLLTDVKGVEDYLQGRPAELGFRALDDATFVVELVEPRGNLLPLLSCSPLLPVPRHVVAVHGDEWGTPPTLVGNGPYVLTDRLPDGTTILVRNPAFPGLVEGNVDQIEVLLLPENDSPLSLFLAGRLDLTRPNSRDLAQAIRECAGRYHVKPNAVVSFLTFNVDRLPFDDPRVRQAFAHAIDKGSLPLVVQGGSLPATGGFVPPGIPGHAPGIGLPFDPEQARRLLEQAGYPGGRGFPAITLGSFEGDDTAAHLQQQWWQVLGVEVAFQPWSVAEGYDDLFSHTAACHVWMYGWAADYLDPDNFLRNWFGIVAVQNKSDVSPFQQFVIKAQHQTDPARRIRLYQEADRLLMAEAETVPITYGLSHYLIKPWLREPKGSVRIAGPRELMIDPH